MRQGSGMALAEIARIRRLQCDAAEMAAGQAACELRKLQAGREPLKNAVSEAAQGYLQSLASSQFNPFVRDGWRMLISNRTDELIEHEGKIELASYEASEAETEWNCASGRRELADALDRQTRRRLSRLEDELRIADHADQLLARRLTR